MADNNKIKILNVLSEQFNRHRYFFWCDADKVREVKEFATILAQMSTQRLTIDLDDGVKTNYPKYYPLVEPIKGLDANEDE